VSGTLGDVVHSDCPPCSTTRVAQIQAVVNSATDDRAVGELGPISGSSNARIARSDVQDAIGVVAKGVVPLAPVHEDSDVPPIKRAEKMLVDETWYYIQHRAWRAISTSFGFATNSVNNQKILIIGRTLRSIFDMEFAWHSTNC